MRITPKNWSDFQHYTGRNPPWVKLHKKLLDDYDFQCLHDASRALAPMLWLLASEEKDGTIETTLTKLAFRLRRTENEIIEGLKPLIMANFFTVEGDDASALLAACLHDAIPETEREAEREADAEAIKKSQKSKSARVKKTIGGDFEAFWNCCPRKVGKGQARKAYAKAILAATPEALAAGMRRYSASRKGEDEKFTVHPATWLNQERWLDGGANGTGASVGIHWTEEEQREKEEGLKRAGII